MTPRYVAALLLIACCARAQTNEIPRTPVPDPRPLMIAAIDSPAGVAKLERLLNGHDGRLNGQIGWGVL